MAAHPHPPETSRLVLVSEGPLDQLPAASLESTTSVATNTPTIPIQRRLRSTLLRRSLTRLLVLPAASTTLRLRDVTANTKVVERHQRRIAVIPLVGNHLFDALGVRLHRLHLLRRLRQRLRQRRRITFRRVLHRHRQDRSRLQIDPMLRLVGEMCPTVLHLRDLRVRVLWRHPLFIRRLPALPRTVKTRQLRPRRRRNARCLRQPTHERLVRFPRIPPLDAPHRRVRFQRCRIHADRLPLHQTRFRQPSQHPREHRHMRLHVDQTPGP